MERKKKYKILVTGDSPESLDLKVQYLKKAGYKPDSALKEEMFIKIMSSEKPVVIPDDKGVSPGSLYYITDSTEKTQIEETLKKSEEKFRKAFITSPDSVNINRLSDGMYVLVNEGFVKMMGYSEEFIIGKTSIELNIWDDPSDREKLIKGLKEKGKVENLEANFRTKEGVIRYGMMSATLLDIEGIPHIINITRDITKRKQDELLLKERTRNLQEELKKKHKAEIALKKSHKKLEDSKLATLNLLEDIKQEMEQRRLAEEKLSKLNDKLEQRVTERTAQLEAVNKELESFAYSISHDLRAPLRAIDGFSRFVIEDYEQNLNPEGTKYLNLIRKNAKKMDQLITDILALSRATRGEYKVTNVDMTRLVKSILSIIISPEKEKIININVDILPEASADPAFMKQVWINLLTNAVKFSSKKENPEISIGGYTENGNNIYFVKDNGVGFNSEYGMKLFVMFQRLHRSEEFEGTGVGLAIVKRIINRYGGKVWAEGKVDDGATFYFSLPVSQ